MCRVCYHEGYARPEEIPGAGKARAGGAWARATGSGRKGLQARLYEERVFLDGSVVVVVVVVVVNIIVVVNVIVVVGIIAYSADVQRDSCAAAPSPVGGV